MLLLVLIDTSRHGFNENISQPLHRKIARHLRDINSYIQFLKSTSDRLINEINIQGYKLLHENSNHHNARIYNRPTSNKIVITWEGDANNSLSVSVTKDVLIET